MMQRIAVLALGPGQDPSARSALEIMFTWQAERWSPAGVELCLVPAPYRWWEGPRQVVQAMDRLKPDAALLLACDPDCDGLRVAAYARNAAASEPDAAGQIWPGRELAPGAACALPATLNPRRMLRAVRGVGAPVRLSRDAGLSVANRCLFALLTHGSTPVGCIRLPLARETARAWDRPSPSSLNRACLLEAGQAAVNAAAGLATGAAGGTSRSNVA